jgi:hypothetical protein
VLTLVDPAFLLGISTDKTWANKWCHWRSDPNHELAEEPPAGHWMAEMWRIWDEEINATPDQKKQTEFFWKIMDIWYEEMPMISVFGEAPNPIIISKKMRGLPRSGYTLPLSNPTRHANLVSNQTYYWEDPENHVFSGL